MIENLKDLLARASWTAAQAFIAVFTIEGGAEVQKAAGIAALGAALSVLKTFINEQLKARGASN
jgi:hypothetical protein